MLAIALAAAPAIQAPLGAQDVLLSEIRADAGGRWVELHNRSATAVDLSAWSLYYATTTTGMPQNYWWPFPPATTLGPDSYVRVFWFQNAPATVPPGELYTGTSPYGYLFSLGGEALHGDAGAFALVDTQNGGLMSTPSHFVDWVSWGTSGLPREDLAVQNGTWTAGLHSPAIPPGQSLARNPAVVGATATRPEEWFLDPSPTPLGPNLSGAAVTPYGQSCTVPGHHLVGLPVLRTTSLPLLGNAQFGFVVDNTTGFFGETMLLAFGAGARPTGVPSLLPALPGSSCEEAIDPGAVFAVVVVPTQVVETGYPLSLANQPAALTGLELHVQALVLDWLPHAYPPFQGVSNALMLVIGQ